MANTDIYPGLATADVSVLAQSWIGSTALTVHSTLASPTAAQLNAEISAASNAAFTEPRVVQVHGTLTLDDDIVMRDYCVVRETPGETLTVNTGQLGLPRMVIWSGGTPDARTVTLTGSWGADTATISGPLSELELGVWQIGTNNASGDGGQQVEITGISGSTVTLSEPLVTDFTNEVLRRNNGGDPDFIYGAGWEGGNVNAIHDIPNMFYVQGARDFWITGVDFDGVALNDNDGVQSSVVFLRQCYQGRVAYNTMIGADEHGDGGEGYGINNQSHSSQIRISHNVIRDMRHSILNSGGSSGNLIAFNDVADIRHPNFPKGTWPDLSGHGRYDSTALIGNISDGLTLRDAGKSGTRNVIMFNTLRLSPIYVAGTSDRPISGGWVIGQNTFLGDLAAIRAAVMPSVATDSSAGNPSPPRPIWHNTSVRNVSDPAFAPHPSYATDPAFAAPDGRYYAPDTVSPDPFRDQGLGAGYYIPVPSRVDIPSFVVDETSNPADLTNLPAWVISELGGGTPPPAGGGTNDVLASDWERLNPPASWTIPLATVGGAGKTVVELVSHRGPAQDGDVSTVPPGWETNLEDPGSGNFPGCSIYSKTLDGTEADVDRTLDDSGSAAWIVIDGTFDLENSPVEQSAGATVAHGAGPVIVMLATNGNSTINPPNDPSWVELGTYQAWWSGGRAFYNQNATAGTVEFPGASGEICATSITLLSPPAVTTYGPVIGGTVAGSGVGHDPTDADIDNGATVSAPDDMPLAVTPSFSKPVSTQTVEIDVAIDNVAPDHGWEILCTVNGEQISMGYILGDEPKKTLSRQFAGTGPLDVYARYDTAANLVPAPPVGPDPSTERLTPGDWAALLDIDAHVSGGVRYVDPVGGSNVRDGLTEATAWKNLNHAWGIMNGQSAKILLMDGSHDTNHNITATGKNRNEMLVVMPAPGHSPIFRSSAQDSTMKFKGQGGSHVWVHGLDFEHSTYRAQAFGQVSTAVGGSQSWTGYVAAIHLEPPSWNGTGFAGWGHGGNFRATNNVVRGYGHGIMGYGSGSFIIAGNDVSECAWWCTGGGSGISFVQLAGNGNGGTYDMTPLWTTPDGEEFHYIYAGNIVAENRQKITSYGIHDSFNNARNRTTDGNGCIFGDSHKGAGRQLAALNVCYRNGGKGINTFQPTTGGASYRNNTSMGNGRHKVYVGDGSVSTRNTTQGLDPVGQGEIMAQDYGGGATNSFPCSAYNNITESTVHSDGSIHGFGTTRINWSGGSNYHKGGGGAEVPVTSITSLPMQDPDSGSAGFDPRPTAQLSADYARRAFDWDFAGVPVTPANFSAGAYALAS